MIRKCFCCSKELTAVWHDVVDSFCPNDGIYFESTGNYGSTFVDGLSQYGNRIEIYICDECLKTKQEEIDVYNGPSIICKLNELDRSTGRKLGTPPDHTIVDLGYNAGKEGKKLKDNPFDRKADSYNYAMWNKGMMNSIIEREFDGILNDNT